MFLGNRIVIHHRIHVAGGNQETQPGLPQNRDALRVAPIGLANHAHLIVIRLKQTRDDGHAERGMVDVRVTAHEHEVAAVPTALLHIGAANRQERAARRQGRLMLGLLCRRCCRGGAARSVRLTRAVRALPLARTSGTLRLVQPMRALRFARAMRLLGIATASASNGTFAQTLILTRRVPGVLLSRRSPFTLSLRATLHAILRAAAARRLAASIAGMPLGCAARPLASIPLFHGTAYLGAPLDAISNGMGSS